MDKSLPFNRQQLADIAKSYPTPFYLYDESRIRYNSKKLTGVMVDVGFVKFRNYFAVKALPNPHILKVLADEGMGADCSSLAELEIAIIAGLKGSDIMFSSNNTTSEEFKRAQELGAVINFDDISMIEPFIKENDNPKVACCRYNPGDIEFEGNNEAIIGRPSEAKYGMTKTQILEAYTLLKNAGAKKFGLHTMLLSNELDWHNHLRIAELLFELAAEISDKVGIEFDFINLGGGIGVPYNPNEKSFNIKAFAKGVRQAYESSGLSHKGAPNIVMENGRYVTADAGYLVTTVINIKRTHKIYIGVDASMSNLMRPGMYGAYHHITVLGKEKVNPELIVDVTGSLCENNDKFAVNRSLPEINKGDYLVIHTAGAHGHAMGFQYNGKLRSAELLLQQPGSAVKCIRRAETIDDYLATLSGKQVAKLGKE